MTLERKQSLRQSISVGLQALSDEARSAASQRICAALAALPELVAARSVLAYLPMRREVDVLPLARRLLESGVIVAVPEIALEERAGGAGSAGEPHSRMRAVAVESLAEDALVAGPMGVRTPRGGRAVAIAAIDVVLVPGLAFDALGHRLGRGGGFYDRFLAQRAAPTVAIGVCFDQQLVDDVPIEAHDAAMEVVLTDRRVVYTRRADAESSTTDG